MELNVVGIINLFGFGWCYWSSTPLWSGCVQISRSSPNAREKNNRPAPTAQTIMSESNMLSPVRWFFRLVAWLQSLLLSVPPVTECKDDSSVMRPPLCGLFTVCSSILRNYLGDDLDNPSATSWTRNLGSKRRKTGRAFPPRWFTIT